MLTLLVSIPDLPPLNRNVAPPYGTKTPAIEAEKRGEEIVQRGAKGSVHASEHFFKLENELFGFRIGSSLAYVAVD